MDFNWTEEESASRKELRAFLDTPVPAGYDASALGEDEWASPGPMRARTWRRCGPARSGAARLITQETHQLTGAMGFTLEYDPHVWSLRPQALRTEGGGIGRHAEALVSARWQ